MFLIVGFICTAVGLLAIFLGLKSYRVGKESLHWPTVEGEIISSEVINRLIQLPDSSSRKEEWLAHIVYAYQLDGIKYVSTQIKLSPPSWGSKKSAKKLVSKYNERRIVPVYHHPTIREAEKVTENSKSFLKFITKYITLLNGLELYKSASSLAPVLIEEKYTQDAKVGNAILEPGVNFLPFLLTLLLGVTFTIFGSYFLFLFD